MSESSRPSASGHYLIWSTRRHRWYAPRCAGYVDNVVNAGRYAAAVVGGIILGALPGQLIPVDEALAQNALAELRGEVVTAKLDSYRNY